jgi:hypothetical protein
MAKKITLNELGEMLQHVVKHMATKTDLADLRNEMATKEQLAAVQMQVSSIEAQLRLGRYEQRLGKLEEEVFGKARL